MEWFEKYTPMHLPPDMTSVQKDFDDIAQKTDDIMKALAKLECEMATDHLLKVDLSEIYYSLGYIKGICDKEDVCQESH